MSELRVLSVICFLSDVFLFLCFYLFFFQAEDGIRYLVRSRGLGDVYKRQAWWSLPGGAGLFLDGQTGSEQRLARGELGILGRKPVSYTHLTLPTSDLV